RAPLWAADSGVVYSVFFTGSVPPPTLHSFPTRRSSDLDAYAAGFLWAVLQKRELQEALDVGTAVGALKCSMWGDIALITPRDVRSEEHTSELQSRSDIVCRLLLEKKKAVHHASALHRTP